MRPVEKPKLLPLNLRSSLLFFCLALFSLNASAQQKKHSFFYPTTLGIQILSAQEDSFFMNDPDYTYTSKTVKIQFFSTLKTSDRWTLQWALQPQIQWNTHQLLNPYFVQGNGPEVEALRARFTQKKELMLFAIEPSIHIQYSLSERLSIEASAGVGAGYINTTTERLAKGFTFIENIQVGMLIHAVLKGTLYLGGSLGHTSNFNFSSPNSGYNLVGVSFGYRISIQ